MPLHRPSLLLFRLSGLWYASRECICRIRRHTVDWTKRLVVTHTYTTTTLSVNARLSSWCFSLWSYLILWTTIVCGFYNPQPPIKWDLFWDWATLRVVYAREQRIKSRRGGTGVAVCRATESNTHINHSNELNITAWVFWLELIRQAGWKVRSQRGTHPCCSWEFMPT